MSNKFLLQNSKFCHVNECEDIINLKTLSHIISENLNKLEKLTYNNNIKMFRENKTMGYEYVKESIIKDKTDNEKKLELIVSIIKAKNDLQIANDNFEFAEGDLIDYFLYEIKANQSKLDYLLNKAKEIGIELDLVNALSVVLH